MPKDIVFEFYKNKYFFEQLLGEALPITSLFIKKELANNTININEHELIDGNYIVIFPGKQEVYRRWPAIKFAAINDYINNKYNLKVVIAGSPTDQLIAQEIKNETVSKNFLDLTGKTNLPQLVGLLTKAKLLISNDTSAVHMAAALGLPTIVLSQFGHHGRFTPYPENALRVPMLCINPNLYSDLNFSELVNKFANGSSEDINLISIDQVKLAVDKMLNL